MHKSCIATAVGPRLARKYTVVGIENLENRTDEWSQTNLGRRTKISLFSKTEGVPTFSGPSKLETRISPKRASHFRTECYTIREQQLMPTRKLSRSTTRRLKKIKILIFQQKIKTGDLFHQQEICLQRSTRRCATLALADVASLPVGASPLALEIVSKSSDTS